MPVECQRDDGRRLIRVTLTEPSSVEELLRQIDRQWAEDTWDYAVLYDSRAMQHVTSASAIQQVVDHTRVVGGGRPRGPLGIVIPARPDFVRGGLEVGNLSAPRRDIEMLISDAQVEIWLARHAPAR